MLLAHIAGSPGAGKTYLGNQLIKRMRGKVKMIELDPIREKIVQSPKYKKAFNRLSRKAKVSQGDLRALANLYNSILAINLKKRLKGSKPVILIGIIDVQIGGKFFFFDIDQLDPVFKLFLEVPLDRLIKQYIDREVDRVCENKPKIKKLLYEGEFGINISKDRVLFNYEFDLKEYVKKRDYSAMNSEEIIRLIQKYLDRK